MHKFFSIINRILGKINCTKTTSYLKGCKEHWDKLKQIQEKEKNTIILRYVFLVFICMSIFNILLKGIFIFDGYYESLDSSMNRYDSDYVKTNVYLSSKVYEMPKTKYTCGDYIGVIENYYAQNITFRLLKINEFDKYLGSVICEVVCRKTINVFEFIQDNNLIDFKNYWKVGEICYYKPYITIVQPAEIIDVNNGILTVMYNNKSIKKMEKYRGF